MTDKGRSGVPAAPGELGTARRLPADGVRRFVAQVFEAHDLTEADAEICAQALVRADLRGVWSHGVARTGMYCARIEAGVAKARPAIEVEHVATAAVAVDGDDGLGLVVARRAMAEAIALAQACGVGLAGVRRSGHFGMGALYVQQASDAGCLGFSFTNASPALPPFGGRTAHLGTSPFSFAAPVGEGTAPFLVDMAMSVVARGKLKFAAQRGEPIPEGLALDAEGRPTTDGAAAFDGVVLPFGGVKGSALSWMMDVLGGVFTGAACGGTVANPFKGLDRPQDTGHLLVAVRADLFMPMAELEARMAQATAAAKAVPLAEGFEEICSPGELEARAEARNARDGIPLSDDVVDSLVALGERAGVAWTL